ncbi:hypothetical protein [Streptomyces sp. NPDC047028]|uniref:hypothetical protein n=1 Tax=Streptomyces sp. NPDC047028 TaxID=3155793 RepID=UPI0033D9F2B0
MQQSTTLAVGNALVVFEGAPRLKWQWQSLTQWTPTGLWPSPEELREITARFDRGDPVLIVLGEREAGVTVTQEEMSQAPPELRSLATFSEGTGGIGELRIPQLDWLPEDLRARGLRFFDDSDLVIARTPAPLRPPLLLDEPAPYDAQVRFVRQTGPGGCSPAALTALVNHAFPEQPTPPTPEPLTEPDPFAWSVALPETD